MLFLMISWLNAKRGPFDTSLWGEGLLSNINLQLDVQVSLLCLLLCMNHWSWDELHLPSFFFALDQ